jgi:hypothetical protein
MFKKNLLIIFTFFNLIISFTAYAWQHEISLSYGQSQEIGYDYTNYGGLIAAKLYKFNDIDKTLVITVDGSVANWNATFDENKHLFVAALGLDGRAYFAPPKEHQIRPYLTASFAPAYLSTKKFGDREQGANFAFQISMGLGSEFITQKEKEQGWDVNLQLFHYCNAGIYSPNQSINILYVLSVGYLF